MDEELKAVKNMLESLMVTVVYCLRRSRRKHFCRNSDTLYLVCLFIKNAVSITVVFMEQYSATTRQLTDSKLKQGSYGNGKTEVQDFSRTNPGLFIFQALNFFPILYNTTFKSALFSARSGEMKMRTRFLLF